jgi:ribosomal protein S11
LRDRVFDAIVETFFVNNSNHHIKPYNQQLLPKNFAQEINHLEEVFNLQGLHWINTLTSASSNIMTKFRPCIDLHSGQVKQIVGGTLTEEAADLKTNYVSKHSAGYYAKLYREHGLTGSHVIMLGPGNQEAAKEAVTAWPGGMHIGGGINDLNAAQWIEWGAEKVWRLLLCNSCSVLIRYRLSSHPFFFQTVLSLRLH